MNSLALFTTHNIFFNNQQIRKFIDKGHIKTIGVSVPVWVNAKTSKTTEPAQEIFCQYEIYNNQREKDIITTKKGYTIHLETPTWKEPVGIPYEKISKMEEEEKKLFFEKRDKWWKKNSKSIEINDMLMSGYYRLEVKKYDQTFEKIRGYSVDCQHIIEIKNINKLISSLVI